MNKNNRVLVLIPYYLPGYRSGGPQRTIENLVELFGGKNDICILTQDHDFDDSRHYPGIANNTWISVGNAKVMYVSTAEYAWKAIKEYYDKFDVIYSCGLFEQNTVSLLLIHRLRKKCNKRVYIAPMGVFSEGAFCNSSYLKKRVFISVYKAIGAFKNIIWSFTTEEETCLAEKVLKKPIDNYIIAEDLPRKIDFEKYKKIAEKHIKEPSKLELVYISRIPPKKNLLYALKLLNTDYHGEISYDIYGIKEDEKYWQECENEMQKLPNNIHVKYCGELKPNQVMDTFSRYDAFLFPTKGENYGHIIYEAISTGCVPVITNLTPWKDHRIIVHSIDEPEEFRKDIRSLLQMDSEELNNLKVACIEYAKQVYDKSIQNSGYNELFY